MERISFEEMFLDVAKVIAQRSTCPRAQVGAVITVDNRIVATGYNGTWAGYPHCTEIGCLIIPEEGDHCQRAIHAETNAIAQAARLGTAIDGATLYYWDSKNREVGSCFKCLQLMRAAGIRIIVDSHLRAVRLLDYREYPGG